MQKVIAVNLVKWGVHHDSLVWQYLLKSLDSLVRLNPFCVLTYDATCPQVKYGTVTLNTMCSKPFKIRTSLLRFFTWRQHALQFRAHAQACVNGTHEQLHLLEVKLHNLWVLLAATSDPSPETRPHRWRRWKNTLFLSTSWYSQSFLSETFFQRL